MAKPPTKPYPLILLVIGLVLATVLAFNVHDRQAWMLENTLAVIAVVLLVTTYKRFPLSKFSYTTIFVMFVMHTIGAHYTYSEVPYDAWFESLTGRSLDDMLGFERNMYDRLVHFSYGLFLAYPIREVVVRVANVRGFWGYYFPLDIIMASSVLYELIEYGAAMLFGGDVGQAYVGTQGDEWDAQKDMLLATCGALIALSITASIHRAVSRDFQREWADSLRVRRTEPLDELDASSPKGKSRAKK